MIVWQSNWIALRQTALRGAAYAAVMEAGAMVMTHVGIIRSIPGAIFVLFWTIQSSTGYAMRRDRIDGVPGAVVMGLLLALATTLVTWLLLVVTGRAPPSLALGAGGFSLLLTWGAATIRRFTDRHHPIFGA